MRQRKSRTCCIRCCTDVALMSVVSLLCHFVLDSGPKLKSYAGQTNNSEICGGLHVTQYKFTVFCCKLNSTWRLLYCIIIIIIIILKLYCTLISSLTCAVRFHSLHAAISSKPFFFSKNCWGKPIVFYTTNITRLLIGQILPYLPCRMARDLASFGLGEDFYRVWYIWVSLQFLCPFVSRDQYFVLLLFAIKKNTFLLAAKHCNPSWPKRPI